MKEFIEVQLSQIEANVALVELRIMWGGNTESPIKIIRESILQIKAALDR